MDSRQVDKDAFGLAFWGYLVLFLVKLWVYFATGTLVMLAESLNNLTDLALTVILVFFWRLAQKPPDRIHQFGHARAEHIGALVASVAYVTVTAENIARQAIGRLAQGPEAAASQLGLAFAVLGLSVVVSGYVLMKLIRSGSHSDAVRAQIVDLTNDQISLWAAFVGLVLLQLGVWWADPIAALVVAVIIAWNAWQLFRRNARALLGSSVSEDLERAVRSVAVSVPGVINVHDVKSEELGEGRFHIDLHLQFREGILLEEAHTVAELVRTRLEAAFPGITINCHLDPTLAGAGSSPTE